MGCAGVMHVVDALNAGGQERVAVNLVNLLPRDRYRTFLCTTRRDGPLDRDVAAHVRRLRLGRRTRLDLGAALRAARYIREHDIRLLHAHGPSVFLAALLALLPPHPRLVWHVHYGAHAAREGSRGWVYRLVAGRLDGIIAVTPSLAGWARDRLRVPHSRVWYVPNSVVGAGPSSLSAPLPPRDGVRIVCVANILPVKDQLTLVRAMALVAAQHPNAQLLLVGAEADRAYAGQVRSEVVRLGLDRRVFLAGFRPDVPALLPACDIGVLASVAEGLPLALLEYGAAGLPAVTTDVGDCADILDRGRAGILVPSGDPRRLAGALLRLAGSAGLRAQLGRALHARVARVYSAPRALAQLDDIYTRVLARCCPVTREQAS